MKLSIERLAHAVVVGLVLVMAAGVPTALSLLPADVASGGTQAGRAAAPTGVGVGRLAAPGADARRAGQAYYRRITSRHVPASAGRGFMALYREAGRSFAVSWHLIASIHRQETAFSTAPGTYRGLNAFGCCAGPMQFNVTNGPVSTWKLYRQSFRRGDRPRRYPHRTRSHPSIYDDFDAIMAAGALLRDAGAGEALDGASWSAAYAYYGRDLFGTKYASQVLGRAAGWQRDGFCPNCALDETLMAKFDDSYGVDARRQLRAGERGRAHGARRKRARARARELAREQRARAKARELARDKRRRTAPPRSSSDRDRPRRTPPPTQGETTPAPAPAPPAAPAPEAPPQPPPEEPSCTPLTRLLGCGR
ncbi:MAG TPA: hypothetical protein VNA28_11140 [Solirubrobacteraceae bacterium]|nr:hypothetical protein [Solirubrobacteraceae bacterium]